MNDGLLAGCNGAGTAATDAPRAWSGGQSSAIMRGAQLCERAVGGTVDKPPTRLNDTDVTCLISKKRPIIC